MGRTPRAGPPDRDWTQLSASLHALVTWSLSLGKPLAVGLVALALTLAALGYFGVHLAWRTYVVLAWRARRGLVYLRLPDPPITANFRRCPRRPRNKPTARRERKKL